MPRSKGWQGVSDVLKKVLIAIAVVWGLAAIGLIVVPRLPASIDYRSVLIDQIEARTGRAAPTVIT